MLRNHDVIENLMMRDMRDDKRGLQSLLTMLLMYIQAMKNVSLTG